LYIFFKLVADRAFQQSPPTCERPEIVVLFSMSRIGSVSDTLPYARIRRILSIAAAVFASATLIAGLYLLNRANYLLFHSFVELFSVAVAFAAFMITWNSRNFHEDGYFLFLGIAFMNVGLIDILHTLAYKDMGVFAGNGANLPTQLWMMARFLQSGSILAAPVFLNRKPRPRATLASFTVLTGLLLYLGFGLGLFPDCFAEGQGLTAFKVLGEYAISALLVVSSFILRINKGRFHRDVFRPFSLFILAFILSELAFSLYKDVFGIFNFLGHLIKAGSIYFFYKAVVETGVTRPVDLLFRKLDASEKRYKHLYQRTPVMLHSIDAAGTILDVSDYWVESLGYPKNEVIGRKITDFFTAESRSRASNFGLTDILLSGQVKDVPYRIVKSDGGVRDVLLTSEAEKKPSGEFLQALAVMTDVTEKNRADAEIEALNRELKAHAKELETANVDLEAFNYSVSHDLRGPISNISLLSQLLLCDRCGENPPKTLEAVKKILDETTRANALIGTLLEFSKLSRVEIKRVPVDLSDMGKAVAADFAVSDPSRRMNISIGNGMMAEGDPALLRVVLENLLGNAVKYTSIADSPSIVFDRADAHSDKVFMVKDNGIGFDMACAADLFTPFKRLHSKENFDGFGIGLATVQRIVARHGGKIWAESEPGKGATFYFVIAPCQCDR
jgi:PAS domain S-box-containing protein